MRRLSLALLLTLTLGVALGLAAARWWHTLDADGPRSFVLIRFDTGGRVRAYGPASRSRADLARRAVGGRVVEAIELP